MSQLHTSTAWFSLRSMLALKGWVSGQWVEPWVVLDDNHVLVVAFNQQT